GPFKTPIVKALKGVDFTIERGENYCPLGPNGSGKTTLIRCILGLLESKGQIEVLGYNMPKERDLMIPQLGYMPQDLSLYPDLSVRETLSFFGRMFGIRGRTEQKRAIEHILEILKLKRWESMTVEALSGGMKRRLSLACALVHKPKLIILDEPTVGVDPTLRISFWDYFKELNEAGATIITTTHVMDEAEKSRKIGFMRDGKLIAEGTVNELREKMEEMRKLIIGTNRENMDPIAEKIRQDFSLKVSSFKFKLEIHYNDDAIIEPILNIIQEQAKIRELQTVEPDLEDIFIGLSNKKEEDSN
ncbi:MAG: ABC transporter ATP-binding protein, partial [Promethearchaeota archaeon]